MLAEDTPYSMSGGPALAHQDHGVRNMIDYRLPNAGPAALNQVHSNVHSSVDDQQEQDQYNRLPFTPAS